MCRPILGDLIYVYDQKTIQNIILKDILGKVLIFNGSWDNIMNFSSDNMSDEYLTTPYLTRMYPSFDVTSANPESAMKFLKTGVNFVSINTQYHDKVYSDYMDYFGMYSIIKK